MSEKHHYIPIFYLMRWTGTDGRLCVFCCPHDEIKDFRRHPAGTAYETDLYKIPDVEPEIANHLEEQFFMIADNDAAMALDQIEIDPKTPLSGRLRSGWSRFLMTLIHRNPETVARITKIVTNGSLELVDNFRRNYAKYRGPDDPPTFEEYQDRMRSGHIGINTAILLQDVMDNKETGNHLNQMRWTVLNLSSSYPLLTSDRPLVMTNGLDKIDSHIAISIGPRKLFIAARSPMIETDLRRRDPNEVVKTMNDRVVKQAQKFVYDADNRQLSFVKKRFGAKLPSSPTDLIR